MCVLPLPNISNFWKSNVFLIFFPSRQTVIWFYLYFPHSFVDRERTSLREGDALLSHDPCKQDVPCTHGLIFFVHLLICSSNYIDSLVWTYKSTFNKININVKQYTLSHHLAPQWKFSCFRFTYQHLPSGQSLLYILWENLWLHCKVWQLTLIAPKQTCLQ